MRLYECSELDEYVRTDAHRNGEVMAQPSRAEVEAVGIEPYCQGYVNPTRTLGFPAYRQQRHAVRPLSLVPYSTLESPDLPWALVTIWSLRISASANVKAEAIGPGVRREFRLSGSVGPESASAKGRGVGKFRRARSRGRMNLMHRPMNPTRLGRRIDQL